MKNSADVKVRSIDVGGNKQLDHTLQDHYVLKQAVNLRQGPKYPVYCWIIERTRSFENWNWPKTNPTPVSLAKAGFLRR
jgi:hypothetical protein